MAGSAGGGNQKTTQTNSPWSAQVPYLKYGMDEAMRLYQNEGPKYYPGSTVVPFSREQNQAFRLGTQRALRGNSSMNAAEDWANGVMGGSRSGDAGAAKFANASMNGAFGGSAEAKTYISDVLRGKYLNSDPYSDTVFQNIQSHVMPSVNSQFMGSGRYGSNMQTDTATRALTEAYSPYASQQYQNGLDRMNWAAGMSDQMYNDAYNRRFAGAQMRNDMYNQDTANRQWAAGMAPTWAAEDWNNINALESIGRQKQGLGQAELNDAVQRWNYYQQLPYDKLGQFLNNIGGNYGGTIVGKTPTNQPSGWQMAGGIGSSLLGMFL